MGDGAASGNPSPPHEPRLPPPKGGGEFFGEKNMQKKMKRLALAAAMASLFAGASAAASAAVPDGSWTGESMGRNGPVKVEVTAKAGRITQVKVLSHKEPVGISDPAFSRVPKEIVDNQTVKVDAVGGATLSSMGIINAVAAALKSSGADVSEFTKPMKHKSLAGAAPKEVSADILPKFPLC